MRRNAAEGEEQGLRGYTVGKQEELKRGGSGRGEGGVMRVQLIRCVQVKVSFLWFSYHIFLFFFLN